MTRTMGRVAIDGERRAVRFERLYAATPAEVWGALTLPQQLRRWLAPAELEPSVGGRVVLRFDEDEVMEGLVRECEPPRVLEYSWNEGREESIVRFELAPTGGGTMLTLEHRRIAADEVLGFSAGWHAHLDALEASLTDHTFDWDEAFDALKGEYRARLP